jgi:hypothetical protein
MQNYKIFYKKLVIKQVENEIIKYDGAFIQARIHNFRGVQAMLDSDLAELYGVEVKVLNQAVKRNIERFPSQFMFQLTKEEFESLRSQIVTLESNLLRSQIATSESNSLRSQNVTLENNRGKHRKYLPYAFTEQGVAMLSAVLRSETAINVSIQIMNAFVAMRRFLLGNAHLFERLDTIERKQLSFEIETDNKFDQIFNAINNKEIIPKQGIFFDGQIFDAYKFVCDIIRKAKKSILLIDNYVDESVLDILTKRKVGVQVLIYTKTISKQLKLDINKHNSQYPPIEIKEFADSHDRFLIIDDIDVYHIGASLKDLGKKWFAFSKIEKEAFKLLGKLEQIK